MTTKLTAQTSNRPPFAGRTVRNDLRTRSPSFVRFNVNHYVRVKITQHGKKCLRKNYDDLAKSYGGKLGFKFRLPKADADGWTQFQMHDLMANFGQHMYCGCKIPFETEIEILFENVASDLSRPSAATENHQRPDGRG